MSDFTSIGAIIVALAILAYYLLFYRHKLAQQKIEQAIAFLNEALYMDLFLKLSQSHEQEEASKLAATVVNEVFGYEPRDKAAAAFLKANRGAAQAEVARLAADSEVRPLIGSALQSMAAKNWKGRSRPQGGLTRAVNLGFVSPTETPMPAYRFLARTATYHRRIKKLAKA